MLRKIRKKFSGRLLAALMLGVFALTTPEVSFAEELTSEQYMPDNHYSSLDAATTQKLDAGFNSMIGNDLGQTPGITAVIYKDGECVYRYVAGKRYLDDGVMGDRPMLISTNQRVASLSKIPVAIAVLQLVEQGKINLDADVSEYTGYPVRNPYFPKDKITPRMLLTHMSSLRDDDEQDGWLQTKELKDIREYLVKNEKHWGHLEGQEPGKYFEYADENYNFLGVVIENVTGTRLDLYLRESVLKPMGIKGTYNPNTLGEYGKSQVAAHYRADGDGVYYAAEDDQPLEGIDAKILDKYNLGQNPSIFGPAENLFASTQDLTHILEFFIAGDGSYKGQKILSPESFNMMVTPVWQFDRNVPNGIMTTDASGKPIIESVPIAGYGYGTCIYPGEVEQAVQLLNNRPDVTLVGHTGGWNGFFSMIYWIKGTKDGFIVTQNGISGLYKDLLGTYSNQFIFQEKQAMLIMDNVFPKNNWRDF